LSNKLTWVLETEKENSIIINRGGFLSTPKNFHYDTNLAVS